LLKNLAASLILYERLKTTTAKAKEVKPWVERMIQRAKKGDLASRRYLLRYLPKNVVSKLIEDIAPSFSRRSSGFIKMSRLLPRKGDNAPLSLLYFAEREKGRPEKIKKDKKNNEKTSQTRT
jgi:large subunit ribosomal protein L17